MFRATMRPSSEETYCTYATLVFSTVYGWLDQTATHTQRKIPLSHRYSKFFLMMGTQLPETCTEVEINILRSSEHLVGFI